MILGVVFSFLVIQMLDALLVTPRIMGQFSGLHPFLIILAVLCMADWFGFYGALLAIPLAAMARVTLMTLIRAYRRSSFFRNESEETKEGATP